MSDRALLAEIISQILEGISKIERRFSGINSPEDFLADDGLDRLDAIGMMLIAIGESLKNFEKKVAKNFSTNIRKLTGRVQKASGIF